MLANFVENSEVARERVRDNHGIRCEQKDKDHIEGFPENLQ